MARELSPYYFKMEDVVTSTITSVVDDPDNSDGNGAVVITGTGLLDENIFRVMLTFNEDCGGGNIIHFMADGSTDPSVGTVTSWTDTTIEAVFGVIVDGGDGQPCGCQVETATILDDEDGAIDTLSLDPAVAITCP